MASTNSNPSVTREKLVEDFKVLTSDVQELLKATASVVGEKAAEARVKVEDSLKLAQGKLVEAGETIKAKSRDVAVQADDYVKTNPWRAVGIAAGAGFLLGIGFAARTLIRTRD